MLNNHESVPQSAAFVLAVFFMRREIVQRYTLCILSIDDAKMTRAASNTRSTFFIREVLPYGYNTWDKELCHGYMTSHVDFNFCMLGVKFRDFENL